MRFWQKTFFCVIIVFLLGFNLMGYAMALRSYALNRDFALAAAETEQRLIKQSLTESIALSQRNFYALNPANLAVTISPYVIFYRNQGIYFQLYQDGAPAYSNLPAAAAAQLPALIPGQNSAELKQLDGRLYCFITANLDAPYENLQYVYIKDMQQLAQFKSQIIRTFTITGIGGGLLLAVVTLLLLLGLTRPLRRLNAAAAEISAGHYERRAELKSRDELGDFARSFNRMAEHIEEHIQTLSRLTENKQSFIDNLAHEIRTPITAIIGYGELLQYANCSEAERAAALEHIIAQGKRIQSLAYKLLDLAYMGRQHIELLPVSPALLWSDVQAALAAGLREKRIRLRLSFAPVTLTGDAELLKSLLINLLDNAVKASADGGIIEVQLRKEAGGAALTITDYGRGLAEAEIAKITEPFYRVDQARSRSEGGAVLGLALCRRICELHQAQLIISSPAGEGVSVKITFTTL